MFNKVLIANRGEIACRIQRSLQKLGIQSVAIYSEADRFCPHTRAADQAFCVGPAKPLESYLNIEKIIQIALDAKVDAIHPGYGFLSENPEFAEACAKNKLKFIGPSPETMRLVGSKQSAKVVLAKSQVPLIPGFNPPNPSDAELWEAAQNLGWPIVLKAAHGGGGKGLKIVNDPKDFKHALASARREAKAYFNNDELLIEKQILAPRHLEVQILGDHFGNLIHLFERDCSVQRRQQKIIEEAPAINLSPKVREQLYNYALEVGRQFHYTNAGTVEFLLANNQDLYFMEVNARLQVEHPITEMITGIDLVEWQIRIAADEKLTLPQPKTPNGHAIECRICAEQPLHDFRPSQGRLEHLVWPKLQEHQRLDSGIELGQVISPHYDSLLAKAMVWAPNRNEASKAIQDFLAQSQIMGVETNLAYLQAILHHPLWLKGAVAIDFLSQTQIAQDQPDVLPMLTVMDSIHFWQQRAKLPAALIDFGLNQPRFNPKSLGELSYQIHYLEPGRLAYMSAANPLPQIINYQVQDQSVWLENGNTQTCFDFEFLNDEWLIHTQDQVIHIPLQDKRQATHSTRSSASGIASPMPATIVAILKNKGDTIEEGEPLMVLEAMKMEHTIYAPYKGTIKAYFYQLGQQVQEGQQLLELAEDNG